MIPTYRYYLGYYSFLLSISSPRLHLFVSLLVHKEWTGAQLELKVWLYAPEIGRLMECKLNLFHYSKITTNVQKKKKRLPENAFQIYCIYSYNK